MSLVHSQGHLWAGSQVAEPSGRFCQPTGRPEQSVLTPLMSPWVMPTAAWDPVLASLDSRNKREVRHTPTHNALSPCSLGHVTLLYRCVRLFQTHKTPRPLESTCRCGGASGPFLGLWRVRPGGGWHMSPHRVAEEQQGYWCPGRLSGQHPGCAREP